MSIHSEIKRLRDLKGWSQQRLADEISSVEGLKKPLSWQTIQQWEREPSAKNGKSTAPKRTRLQVVATLLGTTPAALLSGGAAPAEASQNTDGSTALLPGSVAAAVRVVGAVLASEMDEKTRDQIAKVCDLWVRERADEVYQNILIGLLERPAAAVISAAMKADPPPPMEPKRSFKPKTLPPQAGTPDPAPVAVPPRARNRSDA